MGVKSQTGRQHQKPQKEWSNDGGAQTAPGKRKYRKTAHVPPVGKPLWRSRHILHPVRQARGGALYFPCLAARQYSRQMRPEYYPERTSSTSLFTLKRSGFTSSLFRDNRTSLTFLELVPAADLAALLYIKNTSRKLHASSGCDWAQFRFRPEKLFRPLKEVFASFEQ